MSKSHIQVTQSTISGLEEKLFSLLVLFPNNSLIQKALTDSEKVSVLDVQSPLKHGSCLNMFLAFKSLTVSSDGRPIHSIHSYFLSSYLCQSLFLVLGTQQRTKSAKIPVPEEFIFSQERFRERHPIYNQGNILINNGNLNQTQGLSLPVAFTESMAGLWHKSPLPALVDYVPSALRHGQAEAPSGYSMIGS